MTTTTWPTYALALLVSVSLAGCYGPPEFVGFNPDEENHFKNHNLILHPPVYEWNNTAKEFTGKVILTNRFPDPTDEDKWIQLSWMNIRARYFNDTESVYESVRKGDGGFASWPLDYSSFQELIIKPGESMIFNFSYPPYNNHRDESVTAPVDRITFIVDYDYYYINQTNIRKDNPNGYFSHSAFYRNDCLHIIDEEVQQVVGEGASCNPWGGRAADAFNLRVERIDDFPPPEYWPEWNDDSPIPLWHHPWFRDDVEFLRGFTLENANIVYFDGRIR